MADRDAKLTIETELVGMTDAAAETRKLREEIAAGAGAAEGAAGALNETAAAVSKVEDAEREAADATRATTAAMKAASEASAENAQNAASAAAQATKGAAEVGEAASGQAAAARDAGAAAEEAANLAEEGAAATVKSIEDVIAAFNEETEAALKAGGAFNEVEAVGRIERLIAGIRESGAAAEEQRAAIAGIGESLVADFDALRTASAGTSTDISSHASFMTSAMGDVDRAIKEIDASLAQIGDEGPQQFEEIKRVALDFGTAAALAIAEVNAGWEQFGETARVTPGTVKATAEAVEAVNQALIEQAARGVEVTSEQIALQQKLRGEVVALTDKSNALTNAGKDNAIGLKETHVQVAQVGSAVQALTSQLGPTAAKIGSVFGAVSQFGGKLKDLGTIVKQLNVNTTGVGTSSAAMAIQLAAVAAVAAAAAKAGLELAKVNKENAESIDRNADAAKRAAGGAWAGVKDIWDGIQHSLQNVIADLDQMGRMFEVTSDGIVNIGATTESYDAQINHLILSMNQLAIGTLRGRSATTLYNAAVRDGLPEEKARALALADSEKVLRFYEDSLKAGAEGNALWARGLRESNGDTAKFTAFIDANAGAMQAAVRVSASYAKAMEEQKAAAKGLRQELDTLDRLLPIAGPEQVGALEASATAIEDFAKKTRNLSDAERDRLAILVQLLRRGADMTENEKRIAAGLLGQVRAGKEASAVLNTLTRLQISYQQASGGTTKELQTAVGVLNVLTRSWAENSQQIKQAISDAQAALNATDGLTEAQRRNHQATIDGLRAMDAAREQSRQLESERVGILAEAEDELRTRTASTTKALQQRLADLEQLVPLSSEYGGVVADLGAQLQTILDSSVSVSKADRDRLAVIIDLTSKGHDLTEAQRQLAVNLIQTARAGQQATDTLTTLARIQSELDVATGGTTSRITTLLAVIQSLSSQYGTNSVALRNAVSELQAALDATDKLTNAERERIQAVIDSTTKQLESAAAVKTAITDLVASARSEAEAYVNSKSAADEAMASAGLLATVLHGTADAYDDTITAIRKAIKAAEAELESTEMLTDAERLRALAIIQVATEIDRMQVAEAANSERSAERVTQLRAEIEAINTKIAAREREAGASQKVAAIDLDAGASVDFLRMKQAALTRELESTITVWSATRESTERAVEQRTEMLDVLTREKTAQEAMTEVTKKSTTAQSELVKVVEDGRVVWTNMATAQQTAAAQASTAAEEFRNTISIKYRDGSVAIREVGTAAGETAGKLTEVAETATTTAPIISSAFAQWVEDGKIGALNDDLDALNERLATLQVNADGVDEAVGRMNRRISESGEVARTAAGNRLSVPR